MHYNNSNRKHGFKNKKPPCSLRSLWGLINEPKGIKVCYNPTFFWDFRCNWILVKLCLNMSGWIVWWEMCWRWYCCQYADVNTDRYSADCDVDTDRYRAHWCQSRQIQWEQCCQYIKLQKCQHRHEQTGKFSTDNAVNTEMYVALRGNVELPVNERFASPRLTQSRRKTPVWSNHT